MIQILLLSQCQYINLAPKGGTKKKKKALFILGWCDPGEGGIDQ
jgi:hypothetical protein